MVAKYLCSCISCKNEITTNNLKIHYGSKQCKTGKLFSSIVREKADQFKLSGYRCKFCDFVGKNSNSVSQHESLCKKNPEKKTKNPSYGMKGKKGLGIGRNKFSKAAELGLAKPEVSEYTRQLIREANLRNPRTSYASVESQDVIDRLLEQIPKVTNIFYHKNGGEYFLRNDSQIFFYDLVFIDIKYIVEYQGIAYHPKTLTEEFKAPYKSMGTKEEIWQKDRKKEQLAQMYGFKIRYIWSDNVENDMDVIVDELKKILRTS